MRLIDADKFTLSLMDASLSSVDEDTILDLVDAVDAVDAVQVIRCKDCEHLCGSICAICGLMPRNLDDFCSRGETKGEQKCTIMTMWHA